MMELAAVSAGAPKKLAPGAPHCTEHACLGVQSPRLAPRAASGELANDGRREPVGDLASDGHREPVGDLRASTASSAINQGWGICSAH